MHDYQLSTIYAAQSDNCTELIKRAQHNYQYAFPTIVTVPARKWVDDANPP